MAFKTSYIIAFIFCQMCCIAKASTNLTTDQSALLYFKAHITLDPYQILARNWTNSSPVCGWIGVTCGGRHGRVVSLNLTNMGLSGTIPPQVGNLSFLAELDLKFNNFGGTLPPELSRLHRLKYISVRFNNLIGDIPRWLGILPRLEYLNLRNNSFMGSIPNQLSNLSNLQVVDFSYNFINGEIPHELGRLHKLQIFAVQANHLSGVIPSVIFNISSLRTVAFFSNELSGSLPNDICANLPFLQDVYLAYNRLSGQIPSNLSQCSNLQYLGLSYNLFHGGIPATVGELTTLQELELGGNNLSGTIPQGIGNLQNLIALGLEGNKFTGGMPTNIYNVSSLQQLDMGQNKLVGKLPSDMRNLTSLTAMDLRDNYFIGDLPRGFGQLETLYLGFNSFTGIIPPELFNISTLRALTLNENALSGSLPTNICYESSLMEYLLLDGNHISGVIPNSLSNCSILNLLTLAENKFTGFHPHIFGNLRVLHILQLHRNNLKIELSSFITSLTKCRFLTILEMGDNRAYDFIPASVGNLSSSLQVFRAYNCRIKGNIPPQIGNLGNLVVLALSDNDLSGYITPTIKHLHKLQGLYLDKNNFRGPISKAVCNLTSLSSLFLSENQLSGPIPQCLGNLTSLSTLSLYSNKLSSNIPSSLWGLKDILQLDLSSNYLTGPLPLSVQNLIAAIYIDISDNQLSESIPSTIVNLNNLIDMSLAQNKLVGSLPTSMGSMVGLEYLDLSYNNLSGSIPKSLETLRYLEFFNVSFNGLSGEIPSNGPFKNFTMESFISNGALCGAPRFNVNPCNIVSHRRSTSKKVGFALFIAAGMVVLIAIVCSAIIFTICRRKETRASGVVELISNVPPRISYYEIWRTTEGFNECNLLGTGSFGSVFKGLLGDGMAIAVKVFSSHLEASLQSFEVECEVLRNIRHRNLIKVISTCANENFKALILEYMPNGSLEKWLYSHNYCLDFMQRLKIMIDVASAMEYLHHGYSTPVVHCDLKPSNVLLDEDMVAHVGDFGIAKLLGTDESNVVTKTLATLGYIAPEYGTEGLVSTKCDGYSYGIMVMETFTRKKPSDEMFDEDLSLRSWVESSFPESLIQVIDVNLLNHEERELEKKVRCISCILDLALKCTTESPRDRINMKQVASELLKIKHQFLH